VKMGTAGSFEISDMLSCLLSIGTVNVWQSVVAWDLGVTWFSFRIVSL
jgi:hypothetical protein